MVANIVKAESKKCNSEILIGSRRSILSGRLSLKVLYHFDCISAIWFNKIY